MGLVHSIHSIIFQTEFYLVLTVSRCCSWGMTFLDTAPLCLLYPGRRVNSQKGCGMGKPMRGVRSLTARDRKFPFTAPPSGAVSRPEKALCFFLLALVNSRMASRWVGEISRGEDNPLPMSPCQPYHSCGLAWGCWERQGLEYVLLSGEC